MNDETQYGTLVISIYVKFNNRPPRRVVIHRVKDVHEGQARIAFEDFKILNTALVRNAERDANLSPISPIPDRLERVAQPTPQRLAQPRPAGHFFVPRRPHRPPTPQN